MIALRISFILLFRIFPQFTRRTPVQRYLLHAVATPFNEYRVEVVRRVELYPVGTVTYPASRKIHVDHNVQFISPIQNDRTFVSRLVLQIASYYYLYRIHLAPFS